MNKGNNNVSSKYGYFHGTNKFFAGKRCYKRSTQILGSRRFLQYCIASSKEKTNNAGKFNTTQRLFGENILHNEHYANNDKVKLKDWTISLDLTHAYLHLPIYPNHRNYMI